MQNEYITINDLMKIYLISRATIDRWRKEGLPSIKVGRGVRFEKMAAFKWIAEHKN